MAFGPIYQIYSELLNYNPKIYRRFWVLSSVHLNRLGYILMAMYEMHPGHMFCFDIQKDDNYKINNFNLFNAKYIASVKEFFPNYIPSPFDDIHISMDDEEAIYNSKNASDNIQVLSGYSTKLCQILGKNGHMQFTFDFGVNWKINLTVEKIFKDKDLPGINLPKVIEGKGFGIIEDCGGTDNLKDSAKTNKINLQYFDIEDMNYRLKKLPRIYHDLYYFNQTANKEITAFINREYSKNSK